MKKGYKINLLIIYFMGLIFAINMNQSIKENNTKIEQATFGGGCFWCMEAVFELLRGVVDVRAGYAGGNTKNPTYEDICTGTTGHAEIIQIDYNPLVISYEKLLDIFWKAHNPTTLNRQGADTGTQYRSVVFFHNKEQQKISQKSMKEADTSGIYKNSIVTDIIPFDVFYLAEDHHQDYYRINPNAPYCQFVIKPKLEKIK